MRSRPVVIAADAEMQLVAIRDWSLSNRAMAPDLLDREVDAAIAMIEKAPEAFPIYRNESGTAIRRALLPKTRYAIYS